MHHTSLRIQAALAGGLLAGFLAVMRQRYVWWPFHPGGFSIAPTWIVNEIWSSACVAWLLRGLVVRYGGRLGYLLVRPYFLGLILGDYVVGSFWALYGPLQHLQTYKIYI